MLIKEKHEIPGYAVRFIEYEEGWYVWLDTEAGVRGDGVAIGYGATRDAAVQEAVNALESALAKLQEPSPEALAKLEQMRAAGNLGDEELRGWLLKHLNQHPELDTRILSRSDYIGTSRTVLNYYLGGLYFAPSECGGAGADPIGSKIETQIRAYRQRVEVSASETLALQS